MSSGPSSAYNESIDRRFDWFAGLAAVATGVLSVVYAITFFAFERGGVQGALLLAVALLSLPVFVELYGRLRDADPGVALLALLLALFGVFGGATHGGWDLANGIRDPNYLFGGPYPSDPRGLSTFGMTGIAVLLFAWLIRRSGRLPGRLATLGYVLGVLLIVVYVARLFVLDDDDLVLAVPAGLAGLIVSPAWYLWLGREFLRGHPR